MPAWCVTAAFTFSAATAKNSGMSNRPCPWMFIRPKGFFTTLPRFRLISRPPRKISCATSAKILPPHANVSRPFIRHSPRQRMRRSTPSTSNGRARSVKSAVTNRTRPSWTLNNSPASIPSGLAHATSYSPSNCFSPSTPITPRSSSCWRCKSSIFTLVARLRGSPPSSQ